MHPAIKTVLICTCIGLSFGIYLYFSYDHHPGRILISVVSTLTIGSLMMLAIYLRHYLTGLTGYQSVKVVIMIALLIGVALLGSELAFITQAALLADQKYRAFQGGSIYVLNILIVLVTGIPIYASEEWKGVLNARLLSQQYRVLQLEQQQTAFELELLRAKINPYFLYNVHNTIAGLISTDPQKAEQLVVLLSKFFRFTLNKSSAGFHSVTDEIDIIRTYLQMQQIRFDHRMRYEIAVDPEAVNLQMPSFVLQPLIENAVKHGIEVCTAGGFVQVEITMDEQHMFIRIADSGPGFSDKPGAGNGLEMVRNKLKLLYNGNFEVELNNKPEKYVRLTLPRRN